MRGKGGVAGEGKVFGVPKFHSWGKCTMPLKNVNSDRILYYIYAGPLFASWAVIPRVRMCEGVKQSVLSVRLLCLSVCQSVSQSSEKF